MMIKLIEPCRKCGNAVEYERGSDSRGATLGPPLCVDCQRYELITIIEYKTIFLPIKPKLLQTTREEEEEGQEP